MSQIYVYIFKFQWTDWSTCNLHDLALDFQDGGKISMCVGLEKQKEELQCTSFQDNARPSWMDRKA